MRQLTIDDINALEHGEVIPSLTGRVVKVFDQKTGEGQYGPWHLQTFMLAQGQDEISVTWTGEETLKHLEGEQVLIECSDNKGKLAGVLRDIREKDGKTYKGVKITPACKIKPGEQSNTPQKEGELVQNPEQHKPKPNGDKIVSYAQHASRVFTVAWEQSKEIMNLIPQKDGEEMSAFEWNDLRLRITQNFAIEIAKIIRKERF